MCSTDLRRRHEPPSRFYPDDSEGAPKKEYNVVPVIIWSWTCRCIQIRLPFSFFPFHQYVLHRGIIVLPTFGVSLQVSSCVTDWMWLFRLDDSPTYEQFVGRIYTRILHDCQPSRLTKRYKFSGSLMLLIWWRTQEIFFSQTIIYPRTRLTWTHTHARPRRILICVFLGRRKLLDLFSMTVIIRTVYFSAENGYYADVNQKYERSSSSAANSCFPNNPFDLPVRWV